MTEHLIGVISDTHGLLRPQAQRALQGVELILHAGDIGGPEILAALEKIAPVYPVLGNTDKGDWARKLPQTRVAQVGGTRLYVLHDLHLLDLDPAAAGLRAVICGHSHRPSSVQKNGVLYLNPGSAGPRRFTLPVSLALLRVSGHSLSTELIDLK
ncbi:MAG: metallophosphatase family protein [Deltaproteobacteria bacterium]|nr:metallophosphatase family protein [Deltaproteobacteria bacterium]